MTRHLLLPDRVDSPIPAVLTAQARITAPVTDSVLIARLSATLGSLAAFSGVVPLTRAGTPVLQECDFDEVGQP